MQLPDPQCIAFLQKHLPDLQMRWPGFRKVRKQVCKRLKRRMKELDLNELSQYENLLTDDPKEWQELERMCNITISRFYRDRGVFDALRGKFLPELTDTHKKKLNAWSAGCASGEEAYTLMLIWLQDFKDSPHKLEILATSNEPHTLERAKTACYSSGSLKDLPDDLLQLGFERKAGLFCLKDFVKQNIRFVEQDIKVQMPAEQFDLIFCRYLVFTYFDEELQRLLLEKMLRRLSPGGFFIIGKHEEIPSGFACLEKVAPCIYRKKGEA